jgi:hypothetical protein
MRERLTKLAGDPPWRFKTSIVAIANPAPLTRHPTFPSSLIKFRPYSAASTSWGSSWVVSLSLKMSFCRKSALSSKPNLASILRVSTEFKKSQNSEDTTNVAKHWRSSSTCETLAHGLTIEQTHQTFPTKD